MKKLKKIVLCSVLMLGLGLVAQAESLVVGSDASDDYHTIQAALDNVQTGDYVSIDAGTYEEDLTIPENIEVVLTGNSLNNTEVIIKGKVLVSAGADLELQYLILNATDKNYGVRVLDGGIADIKYGFLRNADRYGVILEEGAFVEVWEQTINNSEVYGIFAHENSTLDVGNSIIKNNTKAGVRGLDTTGLSVKDSTLRSNGRGISLKDSAADNVCWRNNFIKNGTAIRLKNSEISLLDNTYSGNTHRLVDLP
ncbi:MAG: right-handed parallel beta-helix repeat-containing protein [Patescibacteria group bacterium]|jgi:hypothetical protein